MKRKSNVVMSLMLCAGMLLTGCGAEKTSTQQADSAVLVDVQTAGKDTLVLSNQFVGTVSPEESVYVIPMAQGTVTETFFEVGDTVNAGDVLFKIDDSGAKLQLQQAQLSYSNAKQQADSVLTTQQESTNLQLDASVSQAEAAYVQAQVSWKNAHDALSEVEDAVDKLEEELEKKKESGAPQAEIDAINAQLEPLQEQKTQLWMQANVMDKNYEVVTQAYESAQAAKDLTQGAVLEDTKEQLDNAMKLAQVGVDSAELALSYYTVTSPISGTIIGKSVEVNGMASATSPAYTIASENAMVVTFQVSESIMKTLVKDQKITVERNGVTFEGVVTEVGNAVNPQTGLFQIKGAVQANGQELPSGVSVTIKSDTYTAKNEIIIPYDAVYYENAGAYVYTVKDNHGVKTNVTTGIFDDTRIQITEGIAEGDVIITSWSPRLLDGVLIDAKMTEQVQNAETESTVQ